MIPRTAGGADAGAAADPFDSRRARGPAVTGAGAEPTGGPPHAAGSTPPTEGSAPSVEATGSTVAAVAPSKEPAPLAGGRSTCTTPDQRPSSYGMPSAPVSSHHRSIARRTPSIGPPPSPMSRL